MENTNLIWVDKYRPKNFDQIIGQDYFVKRVKAFLNANNMPHLLLSGSAGIGKTTTALVIARELYGEGGLGGNFLELNASDDRGIDVIRHQIKDFAKLKTLTNIPYKIICLDEADSLTKDAQQALRRTMEKYSRSCRFVLACNEISKLIDPIQSRCVIFKFKPLQEKNIVEIIENIKKEENLNIDEEAKEILVKVCKGDIRRLINLLQSASSIDKNITKELLDEILEFVNPKEVEEMINYAKNGEFLRARDTMVKLKTIRGFSSLEILKEIYSRILAMDLDPKIKIKFVDRIATIEFRLVEGADDELQLEALLAMISLIE